MVRLKNAKKDNQQITKKNDEIFVLPHVTKKKKTKIFVTFAKYLNKKL